MKTKIVYVLVSNENDYYLEQLHVSLASLKHFNPLAVACVVTDNKTSSTLTGNRADMLKHADEVVVVDVPQQYEGVACSRYLKTSLRKHVKGPFLYIDTDTVISDDLSEIDTQIEQNTSIAAVKDSHCLFKDMVRRDLILARAKRVGYEEIASDSIHFNGGVTFAADNEFAHKFYEKWHDSWLQEYKKGLYYDQLALAWANRNLNYPMQEIPGIWNCQVFCDGLPFLHEAKIIHYSECGVGRPYYFQNILNLKPIKENGCLSDVAIIHMQNPKKAFVGHHIILGESETSYFWSSISEAVKGHPRTFSFLERVTSLYLNFKKSLPKIL